MFSIHLILIFFGLERQRRACHRNELPTQRALLVPETRIVNSTIDIDNLLSSHSLKI